MATAYTREWIRFFTGCGIPDEVAAMYALIFYENRIQKNMLLELNKEYLRDMGITVMGDVIAILRYAKTVHEEYVRERILSVDENCFEETTVTNVSSVTSKKSTPMKRILEHYTRKFNPSESDGNGEFQVILPNEKIDSHLKKTSGVGGESKVSLKKKIVLTSKQKGVKENALQAPVPEVRRVLPASEGGYKIKMPLGITERSKKLLEQAKKRKVKTVFERLGESSVSSTTSEITSINKITSSSGENSPVLSREKNPSVFSRLGEKTPVVSSTSSVNDSEYALSEPLPYAGILKGAGVIKKNVLNGTMRADDEQQKSEVNKLNLAKEISLKKRLGLTKVEETNSKQDIGKRPRAISLNSQIGEKQRNGTFIKYSYKGNTTNIGGNKIETVEKRNIINSDSQEGKVEMRNLKRKRDASTTSNEGVNPSKKVRFGRTTHRLIPSNVSEPESNVRNYPKLTMTIKNRSEFTGTNLFSSNIKVGPLNSDKMKQKVGIKERIGSKSVKKRLGDRVASKKLNSTSIRKTASIHDRLG